jgi:hypothetical protein
MSDAEKGKSRHKTIFIGHANPEDNYFSAWLASEAYKRIRVV